MSEQTAHFGNVIIKPCVCVCGTCMCVRRRDAGTRVDTDMPACTHRIADRPCKCERPFSSCQHKHSKNLQKQTNMSYFHKKKKKKSVSDWVQEEPKLCDMHKLLQGEKKRKQPIFHSPLGDSNQPVAQILIKETTGHILTSKALHIQA